MYAANKSSPYLIPGQKSYGSTVISTLSLRIDSSSLITSIVKTVLIVSVTPAKNLPEATIFFTSFIVSDSPEFKSNTLLNGLISSLSVSIWSK